MSKLFTGTKILTIKDILGDNYKNKFTVKSGSNVDNLFGKFPFPLHIINMNLHMLEKCCMFTVIFYLFK